ncbi:MAG TPA: rod shape-determining protein MreC [Streptosporangiaceae bacterium]
MRDTRRTRLFLAVALVAALILIAVDYSDRSSSVITAARSVAGSVLGGAERAVAAVTRPVGRFFGAGMAGTGSSGRPAALQRELIRMRAELSAARLSQAQYRQLRRLLQLSGRGGYRVLAASVVAFGQGYQQTVTLDAGSSSGIKPQQTVIDGDGLVGQVVSVTVNTSTVLLASDASSVTGVRVAPGDQAGWVTGQGGRAAGGLLKLQVLDASALKPGAQLVTAASVRDKPFVPGVPVGTIVSIRGKAGALTGQALVRPFANLAALDVVGVVVAPPRHDPRFAVLPPRPRPATSSAPARPSRGRAGPPGASPSAAPSASGQTAAGRPRRAHR